jgi:recombination protein RecR
LFLEPLKQRALGDNVTELVLALSNTIEAEATCHYLQETLLRELPGLKVSRIGFGLPSGSGVTFADSATLRNALDSRTALAKP